MKKLFFDRRPDRTRTALTEDGRLCELFIDRPEGCEPGGLESGSHRGGSWVGRVIVGRLQTILPGQFAFVDIGSGKNAFMNLRPGHGLKAGQPVVVQVYRDATGTKGMYVGLELSLKGWLVILFESFSGEVGVSRKITDEKEARRLRSLVRELLPRGYGAIVRTNAAGQGQPAIADEIHYLHQQHIQIRKRGKYARPPAVLFPDASAQAPLLLKDLISDDLEEIHVSGDDRTMAAVKDSICDLCPGLESRVFHYNQPGGISLFDAHGITKQISAALEKTVRLPCGGFVTFEETEACVIIDVNTGSNVGKIDYRATVLETNLEAAAVIATQIRLRNLAGIIIVDFIDMAAEADNDALMSVFSREINKDRIRVEYVGMMGLGMVQLTRRKTRPPLSHLLETNCPHCGGKGRVRRE